MSDPNTSGIPELPHYEDVEAHFFAATPEEVSAVSFRQCQEFMSDPMAMVADGLIRSLMSNGEHETAIRVLVQASDVAVRGFAMKCLIGKLLEERSCQDSCGG